MTQPMSTSPASSPAAASSKSSRDSQSSSVKDTLESILVAFILAFIFRAFVVEAFVIPTGSMAPTLLGAHLRFRCKDCGWRFEINYPAQNRQGDLVFKDTADINYNVYCPNCGYSFATFDPIEPDNCKQNHPVNYGDRILVLKYLYLFQPPQRWDVVVFKSPDREPNQDPPTYTQNYIKRLIGKPGESIMVLDGDVYIGKPGDPLTQYQIQDKPHYAQSALWRVIYDNDFFPHQVERIDGTKWKQPWTVRNGSGWNLDPTPWEGRTFKFDNAGGESTLFFDREANPSNRAFTDWIAYDADAPWNPNIVHDLKLSFYYQRQSGAGPLRVMLSDGIRRFAAIITADQARLVESTDAGERPIGAAAQLPHGSDPIRVELTNVDYQVTLRINDTDVARTTHEQYHPDVENLLHDYKTDRKRPWPAAEISGAQQACAISHLGLWRDVYYLNRSYNPLAASPDKPTNLGDDEFFVMGDNSLISGDARYWNIPIDLPADQLHVPAGRVPGRFLLGRAFFVYWPAGFHPGGYTVMPALAPDFGDMRFIR